jgi:hypothetical protein
VDLREQGEMRKYSPNKFVSSYELSIPCSISLVCILLTFIMEKGRMSLDFQTKI